jgi:hypothetical protein
LNKLIQVDVIAFRWNQSEFTGIKQNLVYWYQTKSGVINQEPIKSIEYCLQQSDKDCSTQIKAKPNTYLLN